MNAGLPMCATDVTLDKHPLEGHLFSLGTVALTSQARPGPHNPQFSRSMIYNVITVSLTGRSSCSAPCVASIMF